MKHRKKYLVLLVGLLVLFVVDRIFPPPQPAAYSTVVLDREGKILSAFLSEDDQWRMKTSASEVSDYFLKAIVQKEDRYFYFHPGINPVSVLRAAKNNLLGQKRVGASTITMQVVRMLQPRDRTYLTKVIEMLRAFQLELHYSKQEILEMYLNLIPFGSNIEGIKAASLIYLNKPPSRLSLSEAVTLSIIPNQPNLLKYGQVTPELKQFNQQWLERYERKGVFSDEEIAIAKAENVSFKRQSMPRLAPHLSHYLSSNHSSPYIHTTLKLATQKRVENSVKEHLEKVKSYGLQNAMALVLDNRTMEVVAYVGSAAFSDKTEGGEVDGIRAIRSPGSTLKPYLYAKAMENGLLSPKTVLYDIPTDFAGFLPKNYSDTYTGQVTVTEALQQSLNIPAVETLQEYGVKNYIEDLKKAGFSNIRENEDKLGLSLILGGCGVKMIELVRLYAAMANYGQLQEIKLVQGRKSGSPITILDSTASYIVSNILSGIQRPDFPNNFDFTYKLPKIAWKTGTSYGKRDAWAIGYNPNYTIGAWLGNFSGTGVPQLSGAEVATPLLFSLFNQIDTRSGWFQIPSGLVMKEVCSVSGLPANTFCNNLQYDEFISGVFYKNKCNHLKAVWVNPTRTFSYCSRCLDKSRAVQAFYPNYPANYLVFLQNNGLPYNRIPPHNPDCDARQSSEELKIISPRSGGVYFVQGNEQLELRAHSTSEDKSLLWYHNDEFLGSHSSDKSVFFTPVRGTNTISCTNSEGKTVKVSFEVRGF